MTPLPVLATPELFESDPWAVCTVQTINIWSPVTGDTGGNGDAAWSVNVSGEPAVVTLQTIVAGPSGPAAHVALALPFGAMVGTLRAVPLLVLNVNLAFGML